MEKLSTACLENRKLEEIVALFLKDFQLGIFYFTEKEK
jgi:hypothetical protein